MLLHVTNLHAQSHLLAQFTCHHYPSCHCHVGALAHILELQVKRIMITWTNHGQAFRSIAKYFEKFSAN